MVLDEVYGILDGTLDPIHRISSGVLHLLPMQDDHDDRSRYKGEREQERVLHHEEESSLAGASDRSAQSDESIPDDEDDHLAALQTKQDAGKDGKERSCHMDRSR